MASTAVNLIGLGYFFRMNLPEGFDLWFYGREAKEMLKLCELSDHRFRALPPGVKKEFLLHAEQGLLQRGRVNRIHDAEERRAFESTANKLLNLGPLTVIPATFYILQREGRLKFDGFNGCFLITRPRGNRAARISAITRRRSIG